MMTWEEAIEILRKRQRYCKVIADHANETVKADELREVDAIDMAIAFLRPVSREQVEKVWRAHWNESVHLGGFVYCSRCGYNALEANNYTFCPKCGRPFTDEAVQMVMERLEALHEKT